MEPSATTLLSIDGEESTGRFEYGKLPLHRSFFRLVELLAEPSESGCVQCLLHEVAFDKDVARYETLSYCWGTANEVHTIQCNGQALVVTQTLHRALHVLRVPHTSRLMWIDQICINQQDSAEKTSQVAMMRDIYQRSSLTIAWLGDANEDTDVALTVAHRIAVAGTSNSFAQSMRHFDARLSGNIKRWLDDRSTDWTKLEPSKYEMGAFSVLLHRPWFERMWVIQEVGVSDRVMVQCGDSQLDFDELTWAITLAMLAFTGRRSPSTSLSRFALLTFLDGIRQAKQEDERFGLPKLLEAAQLFRSSDPRDKFYALYGLTTTGLPSLGLIADYTAPAEWVYVHAVIALIKKSGTLQLLELVDKPSQALPNLPSWVPSFEASSPQLSPLTGRLAGRDDLIIGPKMLSQLRRIAGGPRGDGSPAPSEEDPTASIERAANDVFSEDEDMSNEAHGPAAAKGSALGIVNLEGSGALRLSGHLVDKVNETSAALEVRMFDIGDFAVAINAVDTVKEVVGAFGGVLVSLLRKIRRYIQAVTERDALVMARSQAEYPTGEPVVTAYRKTLTARSSLMMDEEAEKAFSEWRKTLKPARAISKLRGLDGSSRVAGVLKWAGLTISGQTASKQAKLFFAMTEVSFGRRLSWTDRGYLALLPEAAVSGDLIVILQGSRMPFVVRSVQHGHRLVGPAYVHGIMDGEAYEEDSCGEIRLV